MPSYSPIVVVVPSRKSVRGAMVLAILFGPLGLLYATVGGGLIMFIASVIAGAANFLLGLLITWLLCIVLAYLAATAYNSRVDAESRSTTADIAH